MQFSYIFKSFLAKYTTCIRLTPSKRGVKIEKRFSRSEKSEKEQVGGKSSEDDVGKLKIQ